MKSFRAFIKKEFLHIFRDRKTLMVLFGMPLAQVILFGYAITTDVQNANIAILDPSKDIHSIELSQQIISSGYFNNNYEVQSYSQIEEGFKKGKIKMAVVFPVQFSEKYQNGNSKLQLIADGTDPNTASTLVSYMNALVNSYQINKSKPPIQIELEPRMHYNPTQKSVNMFVPGVITLILMLISAMLTSIAITREKELGNMEILLVSPLRPITIIMGKVIPYLLLSMFNVFIILIVSFIIFGVPMAGSYFTLFVACLTFVICALSLGVLISTIANSQQVALLLSLMALMLPVILLSGFIFPIGSMPLPLQYIRHIIPAKYFLIIFKGIMLKGVGFFSLWYEFLILIVITLFFIGVSVKKFKIRL